LESIIEAEDDGSPGCVLRVGGKSFRVDDYLSTSSFAIVRKWHRGDVLRSRGPYKDSGFVVEVDPGGVPLSVQSARTAEFLESKQDEFKRLLTWPEIKYRTLDFGYGHREQGIQIDRFSNEFIRLVGLLGLEIELSLYPKASPISGEPQRRSGSWPTNGGTGSSKSAPEFSDQEIAIRFIANLGALGRHSINSPIPVAIGLRACLQKTK